MNRAKEIAESYDKLGGAIQAFNNAKMELQDAADSTDDASARRALLKIIEKTIPSLIKELERI